MATTKKFLFKMTEACKHWARGYIRFIHEIVYKFDFPDDPFLLPVPREELKYYISINYAKYVPAFIDDTARVSSARLTSPYTAGGGGHPT